MFASILLLAACGSSSQGITTATVERAPLDVTLTIQGELEAVRSVSVSAPQLGGPAKVTWVVDEGSRVAEGDELIRFDDTDLKTRLEEAENQLEVARTKIEQKQAQLAVTLGDQRNAIKIAELALQRAQMRVTDSESVPRIDRENARLDVENAQLSLAQATSKLRSAALEGEAAIELLRLDAARAESNLAEAKRALELATVTAQSPGLVILPETWKGGSYGSVAVGDQVWPGRSVIELPDMSDMKVEAWVHEVDSAKVAVGQEVSVVIDAHPEPPHPARIEKVADLAVRRNRQQVKYLKVDIALDQTSDVMKPGMTVRAEVQVDRRDDVLSVPLEAVFPREGASVVYRRGGFGGFDPVEVELGVRNDARVEVTAGLDEGDVVALVDPERAAAGEPPSPGAPEPSPEP